MTRTPTVHEVADGGWIVRHTHDIQLATKLLREHLTTVECWDEQDAARRTEKAGRQVWRRIVPRLPNSYGASEGWSFAYGHAEQGNRGAFKAVEFFS